MLLLALLMASSISYPKIRELWVMAMLGAIFLGVGVYLYIEENIIRAALVIIALIAAYLASPVVVSRIRKKR